MGNNLFDNMTKRWFEASMQVFSTTPTCNMHIIRLFLLNKSNLVLLRAPVQHTLTWADAFHGKKMTPGDISICVGCVKSGWCTFKKTCTHFQHYLWYFSCAVGPFPSLYYYKTAIWSEPSGFLCVNLTRAEAQQRNVQFYIPFVPIDPHKSHTLHL